MVSARGISNTTSNPEMVLETMKRAITQSLNLIRSRHVFDLLSGLCRSRIGTNAVENNCKHLCFGLPISREREMVCRVMKWKVVDAGKCLDKSKYENTREWRKAKRVLTTLHVCMEYLTLWRMETNLYRLSLREVKSK